VAVTFITYSRLYSPYRQEVAYTPPNYARTAVEFLCIPVEDRAGMLRRMVQAVDEVMLKFEAAKNACYRQLSCQY
jgi:hypothetical protein